MWEKKLSYRVQRLESLEIKIQVHIPLQVHSLQRNIPMTCAEELNRWWRMEMMVQSQLTWPQWEEQSRPTGWPCKYESV